MVKIDLITGFLGSGKTTFIKEYVSWLVKRGEKVGILENDYGAINVDALLLSDLQSQNVDIEMVAGGCDYDCHKRRFKTRLITMALLGYNRVIVEPSGIFDCDEFFDCLQDDELYGRYQIGGVIAIVEGKLEEINSLAANYLLASQVASGGLVVFSKTTSCTSDDIKETIKTLNNALLANGSKQKIESDKQVLAKDWLKFNDSDWQIIANAGYKENDCVKKFSYDDNIFTSLFFMNQKLEATKLIENIKNIWSDAEVGEIVRIKGFIKDNEQWLEVNATKNTIDVKKVSVGQQVIIVIGEKLNAERLETYFPSMHSSTQVNENSHKAIEK